MEGRQPIPEERLVTLANWQLPPGNRWAFQHVRELVPTAAIRRGDGPVWELQREERDLGDLRFHSGGRAHTVREMLDTSETDGFLVLHRGRVVTERYFNAMAAETPHLLQSVSKSITAAVAGSLVGRGVLDPESRLESVVPELGSTSFAGATVQQLLDMRTGTRFNEDYADVEADVRRFEQVYLWRPRSGAALPDDALAYFATLTNDGGHGGEFRYRSVLTDVMAWVIETAAGARFHEVVASELWGPMGAEFDAEVTVDAHGNAMADGGICATLRDLGRLGLLYLNGGRRGATAVVPATWVADTAAGSPDSRAAFATSDESRAYPASAHYRNYWWVWDADAPYFYAAGINGQNVFVHGPTQTVVVKLSTWPTALDEVKHAALREATLAIGGYLEGQRGLNR
ncbi:MAG TPA: serine hydrolase [Acidimicrobiales bacterium]|nr:serine hydrolase [Acidimicrobiales bacterium]